MNALSSHRAALVIGWVLLASFAAYAAWLGRIAANVRGFQAAYIVGFVGYGLILWATNCGASNRSARTGRWWLAGYVILRLMLIGVEPSDDAHRYLWEGRVQLAGYNPYHHAPDDEALVELRGENWSRINHPDYPAIYGPVAQVVFAAAAAIHPSIYTIKLFLALADIITVIVLANCLARRGGPSSAVALYALSPLVLCAFAIEGHLDSVMLMFLALAAWAMMGERVRLAGVMVGLAMGVKIICVILLPYLLWRRRRAAMIAVATLILVYLPYAGAGFDLLESLVRFSRGKEFFSLLGALDVTRYETDVIRAAAIAVLAVVLVTLALRRRSLADYAAPAFATLILLMPVVHYWYVSAVLMWSTIGERRRGERMIPWSWLAFSCALVVYFDAQRARVVIGEWTMPARAPLCAWSCFLVVWVGVSIVRRLRPRITCEM